MTAPALLFTQCLQNDFVKPVGRYDVAPNRLHVGYAEALRLMGEIPAEGPVARLMRWAAGARADGLRVIHLRDWHVAADPAQHAHLERFGAHPQLGLAALHWPVRPGERDPGRRRRGRRARHH